MKHNILTVISTCAACALILVQTSRADQQVVAGISLATRVNVTVNSSGCNNSGGPQVTLSGTIALGDLTARVTLSNNEKGTHETTVTEERDFSLLLGDAITIPKQPVRGGVGGNPLISVQFLDGNGDPFADPVDLGRCNQL
jgi:hypothetical protein